MAAELGSIDLSDSLPYDPTADWNTGLCTMPPYFPILNSSAFEYALLPQHIPGPSLPTLPYLWPPVDFFPIFPPKMPLGAQSVHAVEQDALPSLPAAPGFSTIWPRTTPIPPYDGVNDCGSHEGSTGVDFWATGDQHPSVVVHTIPPLVPSLPPFTSIPLGWVKIPQRDYGHGRKQRNFKPSEPIFFNTNCRPGMNLRDALRKEFKGLDGRDDPVLRGAAGAISCRLLFPGYPDNGSLCQIHSQNWTKNRKPIPRSKLAHEVARKLERYLSRMTKIPPDASGEDRWRIGEGFMKIDNMFLVSLVSVSTGSFQPEIWVDPSVPHPPVDRG